MILSIYDIGQLNYPAYIPDQYIIIIEILGHPLYYSAYPWNYSKMDRRVMGMIR